MSGKIDVVHGGEFRARWNGIYVYLEDYEYIHKLDGDDYVNEKFYLFENGFSLDLNKHNVVEID